MPSVHDWHFGPVEGCDKPPLSGVVVSVGWQVTSTAEDGSVVHRDGNKLLSAPDPDVFEERLQYTDRFLEVQAQRRSWIGEDFVTEVEARMDAALLRKAERSASGVFQEQ
jgi:hypothetical protein